MNNNQNDLMDADFPPLSPGGEKTAKSNPKFVNDCLSKLVQLGPLGQIDAGTSLLTENEKWGLVFRVDFLIDGDSQAGFVNRLICWERNDGTRGSTYAIGQNIPQL